LINHQEKYEKKYSKPDNCFKNTIQYNAAVLLFAFPFAVRFVELKYYAVPVFAVAAFAAVQEGHYIRTGKCQSDE
jgi:hypothetical protein